MPRPLDPLPTKVTDSVDDAATAAPPQSPPHAPASTQRDEVLTATPASQPQSPSTVDPFGEESPLDGDLSQRFERHGLLGRGGFGLVYRAYDHKLGRFVAVKVPHRGLRDDISNRRRVEREAAATARLRHPHIVTLHDFVTSGDSSLLINELIEGETLTQLLARSQHGCDLRVAATVVQRIAQASNQHLESAIQAGRRTLEDYEQTIYAGEMLKASTAIQERRLRDGRTILDTYADGQPLAHHRDVEWEHARFHIFRNSTTLWQSDQALYTVALSNRKLAVGGAASHIALLDRASGKVVRQWQTGQTEVNSIVLTPDREQMWCSGDDGSVHAYNLASGMPIYQVHPFQEGRAYDLFHFPKLQCLICFSSKGTIAAFDQSSGEILRRWPAPKEGAWSVAPVGSGQFAVGHADGLLRIYNVVTGAVQQELKLDDYPTIQALKADPAGHRLWILAGSSVRLLDLTSATFSPTLITVDETHAMAYDSASDSYVISMLGGVFLRLRVNADMVLEPLDQWVNEGHRIFAIEADPDSGEILSADAAGALRRWHKAPLDRTEHPGPAKSKSLRFDFLPNSDIDGWPHLVSTNRSEVFSLSTRTGQRQAIAYQGPPPVSVGAAGKHQLLIGSSAPPAQLLDLASGTVTELPVHGSGPVKRSADGRWLGGAEMLLGYAWLLDTAGASVPQRLPAHHAHSIAVATEHGRVFWNDGNALVSRRIATADTPQQHATFSRVPKFLELSDDQRLLAIGLSDREVHLWDWQHDRRIGPVLMHHGDLHAMAFSPSGRTLMTLDQTPVLRFWNVRTGKLMLEKPIHSDLPGNITQASFSPDRRFLVILYGRQNFSTLRLY